jgi:hypothetical protein
VFPKLFEIFIKILAMPELLVVVDSEQFNGSQRLHDSYLNGYPDRNAMRFIQPKRIQVKLLKPDLALAPPTVTLKATLLRKANKARKTPEYAICWRPY